MMLPMLPLLSRAVDVGHAIGRCATSSVLTEALCWTAVTLGAVPTGGATAAFAPACLAADATACAVAATLGGHEEAESCCAHLLVSYDGPQSGKIGGVFSMQPDAFEGHAWYQSQWHATNGSELDDLGFKDLARPMALQMAAVSGGHLWVIRTELNSSGLAFASWHDAECGREVAGCPEREQCWVVYNPETDGIEQVARGAVRCVHAPPPPPGNVSAYDIVLGRCTARLGDRLGMMRWLLWCALSSYPMTLDDP